MQESSSVPFLGTPLLSPHPVRRYGEYVWNRCEKEKSGVRGVEGVDDHEVKPSERPKKSLVPN